MGQTKVLKGLIDGNFGTDWQTTPKTADFTADANEGYLVDTSSAAITVTMPSSPSVGDTVHLIDYGANAATNNIKITSSDDIDNSSNDSVINYDKAGVELIYSGSTKGWLVASAANETADALAPDTITVEYLVVAGGGGAGWGGGGAGGLRTSYGSTSGGGASAESSLSITASTNYTVTVGSGGAGTTGSGQRGAQGGNSILSTITSTGGGGGGATENITGGDGGSGGGGGIVTSNTGTNVAGGSGTANEGFDGSAGLYQGTNIRSGAGGGAGGAASNQTGGNGLAINILNATNAATASVGEVSGTDVFYASGGGGAVRGGYAQGVAPPGGGGLGKDFDITDNSEDGAANTGGGAGGLGSTNSNAGGSGVVIIRYPSSKTVTVGAGLTQSTGSPFTEGSEKVSVFTAGTGTISFS